MRPASAASSFAVRVGLAERLQCRASGCPSPSRRSSFSTVRRLRPVPTIFRRRSLIATASFERPVEVATLQQTLNVKNTSSQAAFPLAILGCNVGDSAITFGPNGSPIVLGTTVLVNGKPVDIKNSNVADVVSRPACDSGQALADLKLGLNQLQFIRAVAPGGQCQNGPIGYSITLGNKTDGFYGGQSTVTLNKCN